MIDSISTDLQKELTTLIQFFKNHYPKVKLFIVGGAVRDMVLNRQIEDMDIECFNIEPNEFDEAMKRLGAMGVGKSFFVYKYGRLDIALPRTEKKVGVGHRAFEVELASSTKEASRRRDFTMNALMYDISTKKIIDHWGGLSDIRKSIIRVVDPNRFQEDSLRVLRAMQFAARLKFRIEPKSREIMREISLDDLTPERIFWEFEKMFNAKWLHYGLFFMNDLLIGKKILGIELNLKDLINLSKDLKRARLYGNPSMRPYYFLYILSNYLHKDVEKLCKAIKTPKNYIKILKANKKIPKRITDRFLGAISLKFPIKKWLGVYANDVTMRAKNLNIYENRFDPKVKSSELIKEGYSGKELGVELRKRALKAVRDHFKTKN